MRAHISGLLRAGDLDVAASIGIPSELFLAQGGQPLGPNAVAMVRPLIEKAVLVTAINDACFMVSLMTSLMTLAAVLLVPFVRKAPAGEAPRIH